MQTLNKAQMLFLTLFLTACNAQSNNVNYSSSVPSTPTFIPEEILPQTSTPKPNEGIRELKDGEVYMAEFVYPTLDYGCKIHVTIVTPDELEAKLSALEDFLLGEDIFEQNKEIYETANLEYRSNLRALTETAQIDFSNATDIDSKIKIRNQYIFEARELTLEYVSNVLIDIYKLEPEDLAFFSTLVILDFGVLIDSTSNSFESIETSLNDFFQSKNIVAYFKELSLYKYGEIGKEFSKLGEDFGYFESNTECNAQMGDVVPKIPQEWEQVPVEDHVPELHS